MRPSMTVARAALTAFLALGALPGLVGSHEPAPTRPVDAALFEQVNLATAERQAPTSFAFDSLARSAGALDLAAAFSEPGSGEGGAVAGRANPAGLVSRVSWAWKAPRSSMSGYASFYSYGTTAMRDVPRGTTIVICGAGGCLETKVSDYGPARSTGRIIDMYRPDFFRICGCASWSGTTWV